MSIDSHIKTNKTGDEGPDLGLLIAMYRQQFFRKLQKDILKAFYKINSK